MKDKMRIFFPAIGLLIACILCCGCVNNSSDTGIKNIIPNENPESAIVYWMAAMNNHDANRLYDLSPETIKNQISKTDFLKANEQNGMFIDNITFVEYTVINKTQNHNSAIIKAQLVMKKPDPITGNISYSPIFYTFNAYFEKNEWKVWATGLEPL